MLEITALSAPLAQAASEEGWSPAGAGWILLLPLLGAAFNGALALISARATARALREGEGRVAGQKLDPKAWTRTLPTWVGPGVLGISFLIALANFIGMPQALEAPVIVQYWSWIATSSLTVEAALHFDQLSMAMLLVVTGVGFLIHVFSVGYMRDDAGYPRYFAYLNLFVFFMLVLVLGSSYATMFVGWEGVGLCSYLLIGYWFSDRAKADAGKKAFIVNRIGDAGFLAAMFLLFGVFGTLDFAEIASSAEERLVYGGALVTAITLLLMLGAAGKSAQLPLHVWLPDAMAGPTPVSALIHAATMVTAGVYMVVRTGVLYSMAPASQVVVTGVGALTAFVAATIALSQNDIKKVLAYSTVSQLGFMFMAAGVGAYTVAIFHLATHAFFKALLFLGAGAVIHALHHAFHHAGSDQDAQDMRRMGGLRRAMPLTWATMWIATLAIAGIWPLSGFFSKDEILWYAGAWAAAPDHPFGGLLTVFWAMALITALLTAAYMTRVMVLTFHGPSNSPKGAFEHVRDVSRVMGIPLLVLAGLATIGGWMNIPEAMRSGLLGFFGLFPGEMLGQWLEPVTYDAYALQTERLGSAAYSAPLGGGEVLWAALSTVAAALVVVFSFRWFSARRDWGVAGSVGAFISRKWYFDELYDRAVVKPVLSLSRWCWRIVDDRLIDGFVNFVGGAARLTAWLSSLFQTGRVNMYAFVVTLGALIILGAVAL